MSKVNIRIKIPISIARIKLTNSELANIKLNTPDNLTDLTHRAEDAAESAEKNAAYVEEVINNFEGGNLVQSVEEKDGNIEVTKVNGEINIIELPISFTVKVLGDSEV